MKWAERDALKGVNSGNDDEGVDQSGMAGDLTDRRIAYYTHVQICIMCPCSLLTVDCCDECILFAA